MFTKRIRFSKIISLGLLLGLSAMTPDAYAAGEDAWTNLAALRPGDRVGVIRADQKRVEGRFESFNDSSITLDAGQTIAKDQVVRVYRNAGWSRTKRTLIGLAIGAAAGAAIDAGLGARLNNEGASFPRGVSTAAAAGIGAGIGAISGNGYKTIYRRSKL